ncbi:TetR family transcriptional regulator [Rhodococcus ruber]|nr:MULTISPECIES: TetR family transcriptional regulator [Rhodococcus]MCF8784996.1 TetR family transcriptional regulator [Rhodococcus ruber]MCZ1072618.1 TetR family transcriptional regulator [Rhodococcus sp. A5(2022)]MCZ4501503.1 TetR family transcriptional regulator [Rhodococcus ruber]MCZ4619666.1 TetR family transcriptional regulator [Rhodococcus ruber]MDI9980455.1 TetR family transcriptional regulator [Rhodococcus ruber]
MEESATSPSGRRNRRMERTRAALVGEARALTARHGLAGFTVEELCERVEISRRTFFNYFPSKEDAVLGEPPLSLTLEEEDAFVAAGRHDGDGISPTLLQDLVAVLLAQIGRTDFTREHAKQYHDIIHREPQLLPRILHNGETQLRRFAEVVARRENLPPDDPLPRTVVYALADITRHTADEFFGDDTDRPFAELLLRNLDTVRRLFGQRLDPIETAGNP